MKKEKPNNEDFPKFTHIKINEWLFVVKSATGLKVGKDGVYGDKYTAIANFDFIDGKAHVNGLMGSGITRRCIASFKKFIASHGIKEASYKRIKNLKDKFKKVKVNKGI